MSAPAPLLDTPRHEHPAPTRSAEGTPGEPGRPATSGGRARLAEVGATLHRLLIPLLLGAGVWFRVVQYAANRSLWLDEAFLVPTIVERTFRQILSPGSFGAVPIGFQLATRAVVAALGDGEYALRLIPLLAGIVSVFLFLAVARRSLPERAVPLAMAFFAFSPYLVYYASEFKPYSLDVAVTLLLLLGALEIRRRGLTRPGALAAFAAAPLAVLFSLPSVFVLAGAAAAPVGAAARDRDRVLLRRLLAVVGAWTLLFGVPGLIVLTHLGPRGSEQEYLRAFWRDGFMPLPPRSLPDLLWFPRTLIELFRDPLGVMTEGQSSRGFFQAAAGMFVCLVGALWAWSRRRFVFALLLLPVGFALLGSGLKAYPFGGGWVTSGRLILYLAPVFFLLMAQGVEQLRRSVEPGVRGAGWVLFGLALVPSLAQTLLVFPSGRTEVRPLLEYAREHWAAGDILFVHYDSRQAFHYYGARMGFAPGEYRIGKCSRFAPERYLGEIEQLRGHRVWILFSGGQGAHGFSESAFIEQYLERGTPKLDARTATGASLYLYDLRGRPAADFSSPIRAPRLPFALEQGCALWE